MDLKAKLDNMPAEVRELLDLVVSSAQEEDLQVYMVGGMVRDLFLGRDNYDLDIVVEGDACALAHKIAGRLGVGYIAHKVFSTATVFSKIVNLDISTARCEVYEYPGALPKVIPAYVEEDLIRRDFTANAIAINVTQKDDPELIDPYGGVDDIARRELRVLHYNSFEDDPTRILRGIRLMGRLGFVFEKKTNRYVNKAVRSSALSHVSESRIREELELLLKEENVLECIKKLYKYTRLCFFNSPFMDERPDYALMLRIPDALDWFCQSLPRNRNIDVWIIYMMSLVHEVPDSELEHILYRFAFRRHDMNRLRSVSTGLLRAVRNAQSPSHVYRLLESLSIEALIFIYAKVKEEELRERIIYFFSRSKDVRLEITGKDLDSAGVKPGAVYREALSRTLFDKIDGKISGKEEELKNALDKIREMSDEKN